MGIIGSRTDLPSVSELSNSIGSLSLTSSVCNSNLRYSNGNLDTDIINNPNREKPQIKRRYLSGLKDYKLTKTGGIINTKSDENKRVDTFPTLEELASSNLDYSNIINKTITNNENDKIKNTQNCGIETTNINKIENEISGTSCESFIDSLDKFISSYGTNEKDTQQYIEDQRLINKKNYIVFDKTNDLNSKVNDLTINFSEIQRLRNLLKTESDEEKSENSSPPLHSSILENNYNHIGKEQQNKILYRIAFRNWYSLTTVSLIRKQNLIKNLFYGMKKITYNHQKKINEWRYLERPFILWREKVEEKKRIEKAIVFYKKKIIRKTFDSLYRRFIFIQAEQFSADKFYAKNVLKMIPFTSLAQYAKKISILRIIYEKYQFNLLRNAFMGWINRYKIYIGVSKIRDINDIKAVFSVWKIKTMKIKANKYYNYRLIAIIFNKMRKMINDNNKSECYSRYRLMKSVYTKWLNSHKIIKRKQYLVAQVDFVYKKNLLIQTYSNLRKAYLIRKKEEKILVNAKNVIKNIMLKYCFENWLLEIRKNKTERIKYNMIFCSTKKRYMSFAFNEWLILYRKMQSEYIAKIDLFRMYHVNRRIESKVFHMFIQEYKYVYLGKLQSKEYSNIEFRITYRLLKLVFASWRKLYLDRIQAKIVSNYEFNEILKNTQKTLIRRNSYAGGWFSKSITGYFMKQTLQLWKNLMYQKIYITTIEQMADKFRKQCVLKKVFTGFKECYIEINHLKLLKRIVLNKLMDEAKYRKDVYVGYISIAIRIENILKRKILLLLVAEYRKIVNLKKIESIVCHRRKVRLEFIALLSWYNALLYKRHLIKAYSKVRSRLNRSLLYENFKLLAIAKAIRVINRVNSSSKYKSDNSEILSTTFTKKDIQKDAENFIRYSNFLCKMSIRDIFDIINKNINILSRIDNMKKTLSFSPIRDRYSLLLDNKDDEQKKSQRVLSITTADLVISVNFHACLIKKQAFQALRRYWTYIYKEKEKFKIKEKIAGRKKVENKENDNYIGEQNDSNIGDSIMKAKSSIYDSKYLIGLKKLYSKEKLKLLDQKNETLNDNTVNITNRIADKSVKKKEIEEVPNIDKSQNMDSEKGRDEIINLRSLEKPNEIYFYNENNIVTDSETTISDNKNNSKITPLNDGKIVEIEAKSYTIIENEILKEDEKDFNDSLNQNQMKNEEQIKDSSKKNDTLDLSIQDQKTVVFISDSEQNQNEIYEKIKDKESSKISELSEESRSEKIGDLKQSIASLNATKLVTEIDDLLIESASLLSSLAKSLNTSLELSVSNKLIGSNQKNVNKNEISYKIEEEKREDLLKTDNLKEENISNQTLIKSTQLIENTNNIENLIGTMKENLEQVSSLIDSENIIDLKENIMVDKKKLSLEQTDSLSLSSKSLSSSIGNINSGVNKSGFYMPLELSGALTKFIESEKSESIQISNNLQNTDLINTGSALDGKLLDSESLRVSVLNSDNFPIVSTRDPGSVFFKKKVFNEDIDSLSLSASNFQGSNDFNSEFRDKKLLMLNDQIKKIINK